MCVHTRAHTLGHTDWTSEADPHHTDRSRSLQGPSCPPDCSLLFWSHSRKSPSNTSWGSASPVGPLPSLQKPPQPGVHPGGHSSTRLPELSYLSPTRTQPSSQTPSQSSPILSSPALGHSPKQGGLTSTGGYLCSFRVPRGIRNPGQPARKGPNVDSSP